jgi:hypothetical protein
MAVSLGAAQHELPNVAEIASRTASTVGSPEFGQIRFPPGHGGPFPPAEQVLRHFWPQWTEDLVVFAPRPKERPELMTIGIRIAMDMTKEALHPRDALHIAMEAAIPMSKVDLGV